MENKCENCIHSEICVIKEDFVKLKAEIENKVSDSNTENFIIDNYFSIDVRCKKFIDKTLALSYPEGVRKINKDLEKGYCWGNVGNSTHPCEGCPTYEKVKKGEIVVGDACYWCSKNPNKITCGDTPETISINNLSTSVSTGKTNVRTISGEAK